MKRINCFEPYIGTAEISGVLDVLTSGKLGFDEHVAAFEEELTEYTGHWAIGYSSASAAAFAIFYRLKELYGSCLVVSPALTFTSPVWAAKHLGHEICWVDVDLKDCMFSKEDYLKLRTELKTNKQIVVMPMLYGGVTGEDRDFGFRGDEIVVVDSAHCVKPKMKFDYAFLSFHPQKPLAMSQGGAILVDSMNYDQLIWFLKFRNFGRETKGKTYEMVQDGFNFYMNNLNAIIGRAQLKSVEANIGKRKNNLLELMSRIDYDRLGHIIPHDQDSSYYLATLILRGFHNMDLIQKFEENNIQVTFHYPSLHPFQTLADTNLLQTQLINLPIHQNLSLEDIDRIAKVLNDF